jgi:hypothetical protein
LVTRPGDSQQGEVPPEGKAVTQNASGLPEQEGLIPLPIPVPPSLAGALEYGGEGRFLVLWWEATADATMWSDGRTTTNAWRHGFLAYIHHPREVRESVRQCLSQSELRDAGSEWSP